MDSKTDDDDAVKFPPIYEHDLRQIVELIDRLKACEKPDDDLTFHGAYIEVLSRNGYRVGTVHYEDQQWYFCPGVED